MALEADAEQLGHHLLAQEFVEIHAHHDADGIAAAAIVGILAMSRMICL